MLTYRKAVLIALALISIFVFLRNTQATSGPLPPDTPSGQPHDREGSALDTPKAYQAVSPGLAQRPLNELSNKPLRAQLAYYFPYEPQLKFPAYIWQTWKVNPGSGKFPEQWRNLEAHWTKLHPSFVHEVVTDDDAIPILRHLYSAIPDIVEAYSSLPHAVFRADFFRYLILLARGGIYSDMDTAPIKPATEWIPDSVPRESFGLVIGIEADPDRPDWDKWYSRRIQFCQWTIQSKPGHPVLREIVANITEAALGRKRRGELSQYDTKQVVGLTGPALWTDIIFDYFNDPAHFDLSTGGELEGGNVTWRQFTGMQAQKMIGDVVVLPITSFSPGVEQMNAKGDKDPMAFVKHFFEGTWKPEKERKIGHQPHERVIS